MTAAALLTGMAVNFNACNEQSPMSSQTENSVSALAKGKPGGKGSGQEVLDPSYYQSVSTRLEYDKQKQRYRAAALYLDNGSLFIIPPGAMTPPAKLMGKTVKVTMSVDRNPETNELLYTFGPHGCTFSPSASLTLAFMNLGTDQPVLYYIDDDGNYTEGQPDQVDNIDFLIHLKIDHFSRYAIGAE